MPLLRYFLILTLCCNGRPFRLLLIAEAALRLRRKLADGVDLVAEELQAMRRLCVRRVNVQDAAATAELAGQLDRVGVLVAVLDEPAGQFFEVGRLAAAENAAPCRELGATGDWLKQCLNGGQH